MTPTIKWHWRKVAGNRWVVTREDAASLAREIAYARWAERQKECAWLAQQAPWPPAWWFDEGGIAQHSAEQVQLRVIEGYVAMQNVYRRHYP